MFYGLARALRAAQDTGTRVGSRYGDYDLIEQELIHRGEQQAAQKATLMRRCIYSAVILRLTSTLFLGGVGAFTVPAIHSPRSSSPVVDISEL